MTFKLGLTGSIGMGKSTTAKLFQKYGCDVWDADASVHRLYSTGGAAVPVFEQKLPEAVKDGEVCRITLKQMLSADPRLFKVIESIVHPLVAQDRAEFIAASQSDIVVLDIPLLFETGGNLAMDAIATVYVSQDIQRARVMARGTMSQEQFEQILSRQAPIQDKLDQSDYKIHTDTLDHAEEQVKAILANIRKTRLNA